MPTRDVKIEGVKNIEKMLAKLGYEVETRVIRGALRKAAAPIVATARALAPRSSRPGKYGHMADSIRAEFPSDEQVRRGRQSMTTVLIRPSYKGGKSQLAHLVEFGTRPHTIPVRMVRTASGKTYFMRSNWKTVQHPGARARPFLRPAFDSNKHRAVKIFGKELERGIKKSVRKLGKTSQSSAFRAAA